MASSTLSEMRLIEDEAKAILKSYDDKIQVSYEEIAQRLGDLSQQQVDTLSNELERVNAEYNQQLSKLEQEMKQKIERNDELVRAALSDKKATFVQQIVDGVIEKYGSQ